jgi:hypothetical protein
MNVLKQIVLVVSVWTAAYVLFLAPAFNLEQPLSIGVNISPMGVETVKTVPQETANEVYAKFLEHYPLETALCMRANYSIWEPKQTRYVDSVDLFGCKSDILIHSHPTENEQLCPPSTEDVNYAVANKQEVLGIVCGTPNNHRLIFYNVSGSGAEMLAKVESGLHYKENI